MAKISVYTPTHRVNFLTKAYKSLCDQTEQDWEWVLVLNGGADLDVSFARDLVNDPRVILVRSSNASNSVGYWKAFALNHCNAKYVLELDHDDELAPTALEQTIKAFEDTDAVFVYSNTVQIDENSNPNLELFGSAYGWTYKEINGASLFLDSKEKARETYLMARAMPATPHNVALIWYAPNHLRAFRKDAYVAVGGYNPSLHICDDQDLMCRLYAYGAFHWIDAPLYMQRIHPNMTQKKSDVNSDIQSVTLDLYERYLHDNLIAWSKHNDLKLVDIGCGNTKPNDYIGVDIFEGEGVDIVAELPDLSMFEDNSCAVIRAVDVLEHISDQIGLMKEIHRVLAPGGMLLSLTPSTDGRGAFQDPTHVSFWNENSFWYWTDDSFQIYSPQHKDNAAKFQVSRVRTLFPSDWHLQHNISYVQANLIAIKSNEQPRNGGELYVSV